MAARADAHIHLFDGGFSPEHPDEVGWYDRLRRAAGISGALVVGYEGDSRFVGNNDYILELARVHDWIHPTAFLDPATAPDAGRLRRMRSDGFTGFTLYLPDVGPSIHDWPSDALGAFAGGLITINATPAALARAASTLSDLDETTVIISHLGLPGRDGTEHASAAAALSPLVRLADRPHVFVKVSGLYAIDPAFPHAASAAAFEVLLDAFGAERMMWGSDFSPVTTAVDEHHVMELPEWIGARLSASERGAVMGGTLLERLAQVDTVGRGPA